MIRARKGRGKAFDRMSAAEFQALAFEDDIRTSIVEYLKLCGIEASITDASRAFGPDGLPRRSKVERSWPDITGCLPGGRMLAIEVKTPDGRFQPGQPERIARLRAQGALVIVALSVEDVEREIRASRPQHIVQRAQGKER